MEFILQLTIILFVLLFCYCFLFRNKENFPGSQGSYLITWERPANVPQNEILKYHIVIKDENQGGKVIVDDNTLTNNYYNFDKGIWKNPYTIDVSAITDKEGPSASQSFTSGSGPPPNILGDWLVGDIINSKGQTTGLYDGSDIAMLTLYAPNPSSYYDGVNLGVKIFKQSGDNTCQINFDNIIIQSNLSSNTQSSTITLNLGAKGNPCVGSDNQYVNYPSSNSGCGSTCPLTLNANDILHVQMLLNNQYGVTSISSDTLTIEFPLPQSPRNLKLEWKSN